MITSKKLTAERIAQIEQVPIVYDEDSPQFTQEELQEFVPYHKEYYDITPKKVLISFNIDADILAMMRATGKGYQTRMNKCLREAVLSSRSASMRIFSTFFCGRHSSLFTRWEGRSCDSCRSVSGGQSGSNSSAKLIICSIRSSDMLKIHLKLQC